MNEAMKVKQEDAMLVRQIQNEKGITLIEILITAVVVAIVIMGFVTSNIAVQSTSQTAYEKSVAFQDANRVIEQMREAAASGAFPANVTASYNGTVSGYSNLTDQVVTVTYADPLANPLDATVTVSYKEKGVRPVSQSIRTYITQRIAGDSGAGSDDDSDDGSDHDSDDGSDHGSDDGSDHGSDDGSDHGSDDDSDH